MTKSTDFFAKFFTEGGRGPASKGVVGGKGGWAPTASPTEVPPRAVQPPGAMSSFQLEDMTTPRIMIVWTIWRCSSCNEVIRNEPLNKGFICEQCQGEDEGEVSSPGP